MDQLDVEKQFYLDLFLSFKPTFLHAKLTFDKIITNSDQ